MDAAGAGARRWICVFCGAKPGNDPKYLRAARETGRAIAARGWGLVFGGGRVGMMAAVADAALAAGGEVVGVIPRALMSREPGHPGIARLEIVSDMGVRKQRMIELADAFVTLPGGLGTLDELFEVLTLRQIRCHAKPIGLYNQDGYFDTLLTACREFVARGFVLPSDIEFLIDAPGIEPLLDRLFVR
ncbi:MAG: TIGR00730 family Rossman fold protein [Burkholderiaceae bacterium]|nr:TIGR00730 family Rossman fold protein [Burkholderiaceae bacterium]